MSNRIPNNFLPNLSGQTLDSLQCARNILQGRVRTYADAGQRMSVGYTQALNARVAVDNEIHGRGFIGANTGDGQMVFFRP